MSVYQVLPMSPTEPIYNFISTLISLPPLSAFSVISVVIFFLRASKSTGCVDKKTLLWYNSVPSFSEIKFMKHLLSLLLTALIFSTVMADSPTNFDEAKVFEFLSQTFPDIPKESIIIKQLNGG